LSQLFNDAIAQAFNDRNTVNIGEVSLYLVPVEHLIIMKIATAERKDEDDARRLIEMAASTNVSQLRKLTSTYLGPLGKAKLENLLREAGHPEARPRGKYVS